MICWDIEIKYEFVSYGYVVATQTSTGGICNSEESESTENSAFNSVSVRIDNLLLSICIILLAFVDLCLSVKYIYEVIEMYTNNISKLKKQRKMRVPDYKLYKS